jgi:N-carbamoyl-L-amino-acid hydrolase
MSGNQDRRRAAFEGCFGGLAAIGRDPGGGWTRLAWTEEDRAARAWFEAEAADRGLEVERDSAGNLWAWWRGPDAPADPAPEGADGQVVAVGSHLDTVRGGGAYDGALGVVSGLLAVGELIERGVEPRRPLAVVAFADEEGGRFGVPLFGSRALAASGIDPDGFGPDPARVGRLAAFVELHVEQGRGLADLGQPVALASAMWPHGRWRLTVGGEANHAGTTRLADRRDPMLGLAAAVLAARAAATELEAVATVGRVLVEPNSANSVPERVSAWLDARAGEDQRLDWLLAAFESAVTDAAARDGLTVELASESRSPGVEFDRALTDRLDACLRARGLEPPRLPTAAGHDAGALAAAAPTAMLFVRNPTGTSHSPAETAEVEDCLTGVEALAAVIEELACR